MKTLVLESLFKKSQQRIQRRCFPRKLTIFLRTPILTNTLPADKKGNISLEWAHQGVPVQTQSIDVFRILSNI